MPDPSSANELSRIISDVIPQSVDDPCIRTVLKGLILALVIAAANFSPSLLELANAFNN